MKLNYWNVLVPVSDHSNTMIWGWYWLFLEVSACAVESGLKDGLCSIVARIQKED